MGFRRQKKPTRQLSFFFPRSARTPSHSSTPSATTSTANQNHSPPVAPTDLHSARVARAALAHLRAHDFLDLTPPDHDGQEHEHGEQPPHVTTHPEPHTPNPRPPTIRIDRRR